MKTQIRLSVFETNSSSVHSCSITTEENYRLFNAGKVWICQKWNDTDEYLPVDEAINRNIEYFKDVIKDVAPEDWEKFEKKYKESHHTWDAFDAIGIDWDEIKYHYDSDDYFLSADEYWDVHYYEDWSKQFVDTAGTKMVAWGYVGHD